jgi:hypothetical protein
MKFLKDFLDKDIVESNITEGVVSSYREFNTTSDYKNSMVPSNTAPKDINDHIIKPIKKLRHHPAHRFTLSHIKNRFIEDDVNDIDELLEQKKNNKVPNSDPPFTLVLQRKAIRLYPNDTKIALYYNKTLNKYFSIPYSTTNNNITGPIQAESIIDTLQTIIESNNPITIEFNNGESKEIYPIIAESILNVYNNLNDINKDMMSDLLYDSDKFNDIVEFSIGL